MTDQPALVQTDTDTNTETEPREETDAPRPRRLGPRKLAAITRRGGLPVRDPGQEVVRDGDRGSLELARRIVDLASDKKASDILLLGVGELTTVCDYFVICSGGSERQVGAIADGIVEGLAFDGVRPIGREGNAGAHWVLIDVGSVVVHVFAPPERDFYQLEKLWADAMTLLHVQ